MLSSPIKAGQSTQVILPRELADFQNVVAIKEGLMPPLHETAVHHIDTENQKVPYRSFYNLFSHELKVLCKYLNDALAKS